MLGYGNPCPTALKRADLTEFGRGIFSLLTKNHPIREESQNYENEHRTEY